jgi:pyruvate dehydrogenase E1 component beta subunit
MAEMTFMAAIREVIRQEMEKDPHLFMIGQDVGPYGGEHGLSEGLWELFGDWRVRDAPISEAAIVGCGLGAAMIGIRAIAELAFGDFVGMCMDQVYNQASKIRYMSGGQVEIPLLIRLTMGGYIGAAAQHSQSLESWFVHVPGLKVVCPSTPADATGLLRASLRECNPVMFFEHKGLYPVTGEVPDDPDFIIPLGQAKIVREGTDCTVIANAKQTYHAEKAARELETEGISVEIIDPLTLDPLDMDSILVSVRKTSHAVIVHETWKTGGWGAEIAARLAEEAVGYLGGPIKRVGAKHTPIPFSPVLENYVLPQPHDIVAAVRQSMG